MKSAIEQVLRDYLSGNLEFDEFRGRLVPLTWELTPDGVEGDSELGREIDLILGEAGHADLPPRTITKALKKALAKHDGRLQQERLKAIREAGDRVKT